MAIVSNKPCDVATAGQTSELIRKCQLNIYDECVKEYTISAINESDWEADNRWSDDRNDILRCRHMSSWCSSCWSSFWNSWWSSCWSSSWSRWRSRWTFGKGIRIQFRERDGWKRTVVRALPISNDRKKMAIILNEPGYVATASEPIWIQVQNANEIFDDVKVNERVKEYILL